MWTVEKPPEADIYALLYTWKSIISMHCNHLEATRTWDSTEHELNITTDPYRCQICELFMIQSEMIFKKNINIMIYSDRIH